MAANRKQAYLLEEKKSKPTKLQGLWIMRGNICIYLDKNNATSLLDCGQHLKVFTLSVGYYLEMAKEHPDLGDSLEDTAAPRIWPCLPGKL